MAIWRRLLARPSSEDARLLEAVFAGLGILIGVIGIATSQDPVIVVGFAFLFFGMVLANLDEFFDWRRRRRERASRRDG